MGVGSDYFPTDVRLRETGDRLGWEQMHGIARAALFSALLYQKRSGVAFATITRKTHDGGLVVVRLAHDIKSIDIFYPGSVPPVEPIKEGEKYLEVNPIPLTASMLSGWTRNSVLSGTGLDSFKPTPGTVRAYGLVNDWQISKKLVNLEPRLVHASMFSGAMKRVVQAILGLGVIRDSSPSYITGDVVNTARQISVLYDYEFQTTHGIYKAGDQNHWLVEISKTRGILAMPLPILTNTRIASFRSFLTRRGDEDTLRILNEFGGLPSGETFPSDSTALNAAITAGKVIRVMTSSALAPFYANSRHAFSSGQGWAFSESGAQAHNTCWYQGDSGGNGYTNVGKVFFWGEHWGLSITLTTHNTGVPSGTPVGSGSAVLSNHNRGLFDPVAMANLFVPFYAGTSEITRCLVSPRSESLAERQVISSARGPTNDGWGCVVYVFFRGELLERLKWVPDKSFGELREFKTEEVAPTGNNPYVNAIEPPYWSQFSASGGSFSPMGFVGSSIDPRVMCGAHSWWNPGINNIPTNVARSLGYNDENGFTVYDGTVGTPFTQEDWLSAQNSYTYGGGAGGIARGTTVSCVISAIIPPMCREGYIIVSRTQTNLMPESGRGASTSFIDTQTVGYFATAGYVTFSDHYAGITPPQLPLNGVAFAEEKMYAAAPTNAGPQRQYAMIDGYWYQTDAVKPVIRFNLPSGLSTTVPEKINWVGSV